MHLVLRNILDPENAGIDQIECEQHGTGRVRFAFDLQFDLNVVATERIGVDVDLQIDRGLLLRGLQRTRRIGILEREVLDVLRKNIKLRRSTFGSRGGLFVVVSMSAIAVGRVYHDRVLWPQGAGVSVRRCG